MLEVSSMIRPARRIADTATPYSWNAFLVEVSSLLDCNKVYAIFHMMEWSVLSHFISLCYICHLCRMLTWPDIHTVFKKPISLLAREFITRNNAAHKGIKCHLHYGLNSTLVGTSSLPDLQEPDKHEPGYWTKNEAQNVRRFFDAFAKEKSMKQTLVPMLSYL